MKNTKYKSYILPAVLISSTLFFSGVSGVSAFGGNGAGDGQGFKMQNPEARHEQMVNLTQDERDALRSERQGQREQRMGERFAQLEEAGFNTADLKNQEEALDSATDEMHNYMMTESENYDKTTLEGREEFRSDTADVRNSFREKVAGFRDQIRSVLEQYGLSLGRNR